MLTLGGLCVMPATGLVKTLLCYKVSSLPVSRTRPTASITTNTSTSIRTASLIQQHLGAVWVCVAGVALWRLMATAVVGLLPRLRLPRRRQQEPAAAAAVAAVVVRTIDHQLRRQLCPRQQHLMVTMAPVGWSPSVGDCPGRPTTIAT